LARKVRPPQRRDIEGKVCMRKRESVSVKKPYPQRPTQSSQTHPADAAATSAYFEPVSWLALLGVLIGACLTMAFPNFDPLTALLGQFP
jgi:hypothetical protein